VHIPNPPIPTAGKQRHGTGERIGLMPINTVDKFNTFSKAKILAIIQLNEKKQS